MEVLYKIQETLAFEKNTKIKYIVLTLWDDPKQRGIISQIPNFFVINIILKNMCYLKNLRHDENADLDELMKKGEDTEMEPVEVESNVLIPCLHKHLEPTWSHEQQMLIGIFELIEKNNFLIREMNKSLKGHSQYLEKGSIQTEKQLKIRDFSLRESSKQEEPASIFSQSSSLASKLFGSKAYKYSLQLAQPFPQTIYKERNFNLDLRLVDSQGKIVRNCNIMNLCCAVASSEAQWIHQNRVGEPFLKGKTEVELYKGQASFAKLYAREVSRVYSEGKINLVIYSKPTTLLYSGSNSFQMAINSQEIKPLVISDVIIKAKKKE